LAYGAGIHPSRAGNTRRSPGPLATAEGTRTEVFAFVDWTMLAALAVFPAVRKPVERRDWPRLILLGVIWMSLPYILFPLAQERIDCSFTGMLNAGVPLYGAFFTTRVDPTHSQAAREGAGPAKEQR